MEINLQIADNAGVFTSRFNGSKSTIVAEAVVQIGPVKMSCPIWMRLQTDKSTGETSVVTEPGLPKNVSFIDEASEEETKQTILEHAIVWNLFQSLCDKAEFRLTHTPVVGAQNTGKLVKRIVAGKQTPTE